MDRRRTPQKSPSVNNLISFWSERETPAHAHDPELVPAPGRGQRRSPRSGSLPPSNSSPSSALTSSSVPIPSSSSGKPGDDHKVRISSPSQTSNATPPSKGAAPLFPLRSVAPAQTRIFGTQRHALDEAVTVPLVSPPAVPIKGSERLSGQQARPPHTSTHQHVVGKRDSMPSSSSVTKLPRTRPLPPAANPSQGILKLSVIPPAQSKDATLKHHQHLARSHPLMTASEPLGQPIDALQSFVKSASEWAQSPAALQLGKISSTSTRESGDHGNTEAMPTNKGPDRRQALKNASRPSSEPVLMPQAEHTPGNQWRTKSSSGSQAVQGRGKPEIMYAVVKGLPPKPAIPKLVGATGSGTVVIANSHQEHDKSITGIPTSISESLARPHPQLDSQNVSNYSAHRMHTSSQSSKADSMESLATSMDFKDDFLPEYPTGGFDDRDGREETTLLNKEVEQLPSAKTGSRIKLDGSSIHGSPNSPVKRPDPHKYNGGTPLGTAKSGRSPEHTTLDSTDALFQATAPLVTFPALDAYLSSLKPVKFSMVEKSTDVLTPSSSKQKKAPVPDPRDGMFPPLSMVPIGVSLDELKVNVTKPPGFFDQELQNVMLSSAVDGIMSGESSNIGISWMRLEIIRDFLQFVGLYLSVSGNTFVNQKWLYATVNIIPAVLSLDFPRAVGYGMVFLILFALICFIALYTFKIMTRTDPNDDIEGLEVSSWSLRSKKQRLETISIVFLLTTLYLPLAKLSFDALVWSDTMWPIANPFKTTDFPTLEPLGPSGIYRDPSDFCYVTSMKIQDLNFAYAIIPLAIFTLCANTFYFPLAIRRLVVLNLPRIDKYTEQGERRLDPDEEYKRLTNSDNCPYNFLYNGYRREQGTYKVVVMFNKLLAVVIVVLFSKDNCLFRGYERRTIEATRAGLQIILTASLIYRHYRTQPFLYASQNLSEYWSRACTVATSVIGLFIVLKVGPLSSNALGIMLVATYVLMCVIVIWFVIRQTQKFQVMLKQLQQRLDFSLEIFNPRLNYFKHIKRRIWQETWTTTLLVEESFKMPADKVVAYSQSPHRPPYLLNFTGTVAERHVENLRIVRQIGLRSYSQACQFLTPTMVRKRALILQEFVGPDMYYAPEFMASNIKTYFGKAYVVPFPFSVVFVYDESSVVVTLVKEHDLDRYIQQNQDPEILRRREVRHQLRALDGKFVVRPFIETRGIQRGRESHGTVEMSLANAPVSYKRGLFTIHRKKMSSWQGHNMNPGFSVTITYSDGEVQDPEGSSQLLHETTIGHDTIGITRDFQMTHSLSRLLRDNHALVSRGVKKVKKVMQAYQAHYRTEAQRKDETLSYDFFINVYDNPTLKQKDLEPLLLATEENPKIRHPTPQIKRAIDLLYERMAAVNRTRCHQWWYLFWDDLYRKNHEEITQLVPKEFSPAFPGSICYRPMARPDLEKFLEKQGCWQKDGKAGFMHVGVLNRMYTFLNELVFETMTKEQRRTQLKLTTIERQRLENLFLVTKAKVHVDGTYKSMPRIEEYPGTDIESSFNPGDKPSVRPNKKPSSKKGWFNSITPGRLRKPSGQLHVENYSPGYIVPQTWHQKASQFTALLIGGRPQDMIGESDEEDDLEDDDRHSEKRSKTSLGSITTISLAGSNSTFQHKRVPVQHNDSLGRNNSEAFIEQRQPLLSHGPTSSLPQRQATMEHGEVELIPLNKRSSSEEGERIRSRQAGGSEETLYDKSKVKGFRGLGEDPGVVSDAMSITSMSSEDWW